MSSSWAELRSSSQATKKPLLKMARRRRRRAPARPAGDGRLEGRRAQSWSRRHRGPRPGAAHEWSTTWFRRPRCGVTDDEAMAVALAEAEVAGAAGDVPVGAVVLGPEGDELARAGNERERTGDPTE